MANLLKVSIILASGCSDCCNTTVDAALGVLDPFSPRTCLTEIVGTGRYPLLSLTVATCRG